NRRAGHAGWPVALAVRQALYGSHWRAADALPCTMANADRIRTSGQRQRQRGNDRGGDRLRIRSRFQPRLPEADGRAALRLAPWRPPAFAASSLIAFGCPWRRGKHFAVKSRSARKRIAGRYRWSIEPKCARVTDFGFAQFLPTSPRRERQPLLARRVQ